MWSDRIFEGLETLFIACIVLAFALGGLLLWVLPSVWNWLKPIIHAATA